MLNENAVLPVVRLGPSWGHNLGVFSIGAVIACWGGLPPLLVVLGFSLWRWQDYPIDWELLGATFSSGVGVTLPRYCKKHWRKLVPPSFEDELREAEEMVAADQAAGVLTTVEKTMTITSSPAPAPAVAALVPNPTQPPVQPAQS